MYVDDPFSLQISGDLRNANPADSEHFCKKFLGQVKRFTASAVACQEQPASRALSNGMERIARRGLGQHINRGWGISQQQTLQLRGRGMLNLPEFGTVETDDFAFQLTERTSTKRLGIGATCSPTIPSRPMVPYSISSPFFINAIIETMAVKGNRPYRPARHR
jgi:hypothetical protein